MGTLHRPSSSDRKDGQGQRFVTLIKNIFTHKLKALEGQLFFFYFFPVGYYFPFFEKGVINWVIFFPKARINFPSGSLSWVGADKGYTRGYSP